MSTRTSGTVATSKSLVLSTIFIGLAMVGLTSTVSAQDLFAPQEVYRVGTHPGGIAAGDFNHDGRADFAVGLLDGSNSIAVMYQLADGTFGNRTMFDAGGGAYSITRAADLNGDNRLDLVAVNRTSSNVGVLYGNAAGGFDSPLVYAVSSDPRTAVIADFDKDDHLDIAVASKYWIGTNVTILSGSAAGTFSAGGDYKIGEGLWGIDAADMDKDGFTDLVITDFDTDSVHVALNQSDGTFTAVQTYAVGQWPRGISAVDLDDDGRLDIVCANGRANTVSTLTQQTDGTFAARTDYPCGGEPRYLLAEDFDGDGNEDIAIANISFSQLSVLRGCDPDGLATCELYAVQRDGAFLAVADFNGDNLPDLITANYLDHTVSILYNVTPEPGTMGLLAIGGLALLRRRCNLAG